MQHTNQDAPERGPLGKRRISHQHNNWYIRRSCELALSEVNQ